jgi:SpoVK/Ycf46/Vps4 family AAA+-type ATPase
LKEGNPEVLPMGYLICGPVGTGKTFLVQCFAKDVGIPMVKLKNFRSQWQGVTEGNLEKILNLLEAMAPVAVMIDEADAYLGDRSASGDSGVSSRVFSQIASFMSNTEHRGRIIWFLMTARPDLMPIDLKRQGRAEEHLALFPPQNSEEKEELFRAMAKKTKIKLEVEVVPELLLSDSYHLSGADMEAVLTRAKFEAVAHGKESVDLAMLEQVIQNFIPPTYPEEVELQTLLAVLECTSKKLLPDVYTQMDRQELLSRIEELRFRIA